MAMTVTISTYKYGTAVKVHVPAGITIEIPVKGYAAAEAIRNALEAGYLEPGK